MPRKSRQAESRAYETRKANERPMPSTQYEGKLYVPLNEIPPDMVYSWVRVAHMNQNDSTNVGARFRQGWEPVPRDRHASTFPLFDIPGVTDAASANTKVIVVGGLMLCQCKKKDYLARRKQKEMESLSVMKGVQFATGLKNQDTPVFDQSGQTMIERETTSEQPEFQD